MVSNAAAAPSPKILHLPRSRRNRRKHTKPATHHHSSPLLLMHRKYHSNTGKLESLFDQENTDHPPTRVQRRERVEEIEIEDCGELNGGDGGVFEEEKWRFQAEMLRAECNLLRMEREFALKKLVKNRVKMERTLRSAVQILVSGRKKIFEGKNLNAVLEEEIEDLAEKLEELRKSSRVKDSQGGNCSNFDRKASFLQRRLEKLGGLSDDKGSLNEDESNISMHTRCDIDKEHITSNSNDKMEGLSNGMLDRVEKEYNSMVSISTANSSVASSASASKRIECPEFRQLYQDALPNENKCSGRCKAIVRRIVEQVRAETEQWSQMQEMLGQVRGEMEELQASRDYWENRAHHSDLEIQSLRHAVEEWKVKAFVCEEKANQLQLELSVLKEEMQKTKADLPLAAQLVKERLGLNNNSHEEICKLENDKLNTDQEPATADLPPLSLGKQLAKEKRMLLHRLRGNRHANKRELLEYEERRRPYSNSTGIEHPKRSPLRDIGNSAPMPRENRRAGSDFHSSENSRTRGSFRKF